MNVYVPIFLFRKRWVETGGGGLREQICAQVRMF